MNVLEWALRQSGAVERDVDVTRRVTLPLAFREGVETFYDYRPTDERQHTCTGTACHFARQGSVRGAEAHCFGRCYEAPVTSASIAGEIPGASLVASPVVPRRLLHGRAPDPASEYLRLPSGPQILEAVTRAGLRGRGGAAFPTGLKWKLARDTPARERYVVANGDEGDRGFARRAEPQTTLSRRAWPGRPTDDEPRWRTFTWRRRDQRE